MDRNGTKSKGREMSSKTLKTQFNSRLVTAGAVLLLLTACEDGAGFQLPTFGGDGTESAGATLDAPSVSFVERDVEAPEVFSVEEAGLWDGRPSLGGVWVAHPTAVDPERVIIRNTANGQFVIGALFRRERENPGPALQVSSDAASELGVLPGSPTQLSVVALRREEAPEETPTLATAALTEPAEIAAAPLDPVESDITEIAAASLDTITEATVEAPVSNSLTGAAAIAIAAAEAAATEDAPASAPATAPAPAAASSLEKPFIQIGIFSVEANATRTNDMLRADGLIGTVLSQTSNGRPFWRVIVGPSPTASDRAAVLSKVKALGFGDAYFVTN